MPKYSPGPELWRLIFWLLVFTDIFSLNFTQVCVQSVDFTAAGQQSRIISHHQEYHKTP